MIFVIPISGGLAILWILWVLVFPKFGKGNPLAGCMVLITSFLTFAWCCTLVLGANKIARFKLDNAAKNRIAKANPELSLEELTALFFDARD